MQNDIHDLSAQLSQSKSFQDKHVSDQNTQEIISSIIQFVRIYFIYLLRT